MKEDKSTGTGRDGGEDVRTEDEDEEGLEIPSFLATAGAAFAVIAAAAIDEGGRGFGT